MPYHPLVPHFEKLITHTNYDELYIQRKVLIEVQDLQNNLNTWDALEGLISFLDFILDAAETAQLWKHPLEKSID